MQKLLDEMEQNGSDEYTRDSEISAKVQKLIDVGLLKIDSDHSRVYPPYNI